MYHFHFTLGLLGHEPNIGKGTFACIPKGDGRVPHINSVITKQELGLTHERF